MILLLNEIVEKGFEVREFIIGLNEHLRNLLICISPDTVKLLETSDVVQKRYLDQVKTISNRGTLLLNAIEVLASRRISELPVIDSDGRPIGLLDITDVISLDDSSSTCAAKLSSQTFTLQRGA